MTSVCLLRFHDGTAKPNWGGRATSLALGRIIESSSSFELSSVVNGSLMVAGVPELDRLSITRSAGVRGLSRWPVKGARRLVAAATSRAIVDGFAHVDEWAGRLISASAPSPQLDELRSALAGADELWMNGEGDFILLPRLTLLRSLVFMAMGHQMGKPVRLVNSILSLPPAARATSVVVDSVRAVLTNCSSISYRDPTSLRLHQELFLDQAASWAPDALFTWAPDVATLATSTGEFGFGPSTEGLPPGVQRLLFEERPFVVVSGSSAVQSKGRAAGATRLQRLLNAVRAGGQEVVVVSTCSADDWMLGVARQMGVETVPASIPLGSGLLLLARASCFVSGRYHPSILASLVGTPLVLMASNSHKTLSLQEILGIEHPREFPFFTEGDENEALLRAIADSSASIASTRPVTLNRVDELASMAKQMVPSPG